MKLSLAQFIRISLMSCCWLVQGLEARAASVQVMLFGQPCQLEGPAPLTETQLKAIHNIGPEQTLISESMQSLQNSLERLSQKSEIPEAFLIYVERRTKAIKTRLSFEEAISSARKSRSSELFSQTVKPLIHPRRLGSLTRLFEKALKAGNSPSAWEQTRSYFAESAGPDGEEDFHRARRKLKVNYHCTFEDSQAADEVMPPPAAKKP